MSESNNFDPLASTHFRMTPSNEFNEELRSEHADALDKRHVDFDWHGLEEALGEAGKECGCDDWAKLSEAFRLLSEWSLKANTLQQVGIRTIALAWVLNPGYFDGSPSMRKLAKAFGVNRSVLSNFTSEVRRKYGITNRAQSHGWNFKKDKTP